MIARQVIVIPFHIPWNWPADYSKQTAKVLSKKNIIICFLLENSKSIKEYVILRRKPEILKKCSKNFYIYRPLHVLPFRRFKIVSRFNIFLNVLAVKLLSIQFELKFKLAGKILWLFHPKHQPLLKLFGEKYLIVYDCVDFFTMDSTSPEGLNENYEKKLLKTADVVTAISHVLVRHLKKSRADVFLVPQGFRIKSFEKLRMRKISKPLLSQLTIKKPKIGFVGIIDMRLDFQLLIPLVKENPQWEFVFWGPTLSPDDKSSQVNSKVKTFLELPNVTHGEEKRNKYIPFIVEQFTIGIIPYNVSFDFNRYCYPMKLFEYFYMGKPVVSTPIEELKRFPKLVKVGKTVKEWEKHIERLLSRPWPRKYALKQKRLAEDNSWEHKIKAISQVIE